MAMPAMKDVRPAVKCHSGREKSELQRRKAVVNVPQRHFMQHLTIDD